VYLVEGEPDAISAVAAGLLAIAVPGAGGWRAAWGIRFSGITVRILTDHDEPGGRLATQVAGDLAGHASSVRLLSWPIILQREPSPGYDLGQWLLDRDAEASR
jgi:hypothetical protein